MLPPILNISPSLVVVVVWSIWQPYYFDIIVKTVGDLNLIIWRNHGNQAIGPSYMIVNRVVSLNIGQPPPLISKPLHSILCPTLPYFRVQKFKKNGATLHSSCNCFIWTSYLICHQLTYTIYLLDYNWPGTIFFVLVLHLFISWLLYI
jgi:hypothetical protein